MKVDDLIDAIGDIDDWYLEAYSPAMRKKRRIPWGLITAAACYCLVLGSMIFLYNMGLLPGQNVDPATTEPSVTVQEPLQPPKTWSVSISQKGALSDTGYYYRELLTGILQYIDFATGNSTILLCQVPGCTHTDRSCGGKLIGSNSSMFFARDHLYYIGAESLLFRVDADGRNEEQIGILGTGLDFSSLGSFAVTQNYLYYAGTGRNNVKYVSRIHLTTGKDDLLVVVGMKEGASSQDWDICAAWDGGVIYRQRDTLQWDSLPEETKDIAHPDSDGLVERVLVKYWDQETGAVSTLMEKYDGQFGEALLVHDGVLYYAGYGLEGSRSWQLYAYDLASRTDSVVLENTNVRILGGGYVLIRNSWRNMELLSPETGAYLPCQIMLKDVLAVSDKGAVLSRYTDEFLKTVCGYVAYADMADGLQEEDFQQLNIDLE